MVCQMMQGTMWDLNKTWKQVEVSFTESQVLDYILHNYEKWFTFKGSSKLIKKQGFPCLPQILWFLKWKRQNVYQPMKQLGKNPFTNPPIYHTWIDN